MPGLLELTGIRKRFGPVVANAGVDLRVQAGAVHAVVGENGAGKTTLMNIAYGMYQPDAGEIRWRGQPVSIRRPADAIALGIGMVHQHFMLVPTVTVVENMALGTRGARPTPLNLAAVADELTRVSQHYGLTVDPWATVEDLSVGEQQRVEIVRALVRGADLLILDEPTSVLTPQETQDLFTVLRRLTADGKAVVFISHKLHEVLAVADRVTVLRDGSVVESIPCAEATPGRLARGMTGRPVDLRHDVVPTTGDEPVAVLEGVTVVRDGVRRLEGVSLEVRGGEILGVAGVSGNGQTELVRALYGLEELAEGRIRILGRDVAGAGSRALVDLGIGYIPEDRLRDGVVPSFSVAHNLLLKDFGADPYSRWGFVLSHGRMRDRAARLVQAYRIKAPTIDEPVRRLSGGNQQRVVVARELERHPRFLIASQPTQGLDVASGYDIEELLLDHKRRGAGILLISTELEQIRSLCDRAAVLAGGRVTGIVNPRNTTPEQFGLMMAGTPLEELSS